MNNKFIISIIILLLCVRCVNPILGENSALTEKAVQQIYEIATSDKYWNLTEKEKALIKKISEFGPEALPYLVELLGDARIEVRIVAAEATEEIASELDVIEDRYLNAILRGIDLGHSGLPNVLCRIKSPEARKGFVDRFLKDSSSPQNQYQNAFRWYGQEFIPYIIEAAISDQGENYRAIYLLGYALSKLEHEDRTIAATKLMEAIENPNLSLNAKNTLLLLVGNLGESGRGVENQLLQIWEKEVRLTASAAQALVGIRSKKSGLILAELLSDEPDILLLRDIAEVGAAAMDAGEKIAALLDYPDWEIRLGAARTLGFIGAVDTVDQLIELLNEPSDVRLNYVVAESLGRIRSKSALADLEDASVNHWHPAVRRAASRAINKITTGSDYELKFHPDNFSLEYFNYQNMGIEASENTDLKAVVEPSDRKLYGKRDADALANLSYETEIIGYGAGDEEAQIDEKGEDAVIVVHEGNMVEHRHTISQIPDVAVRVHNGWLGGSYRGEWGGELAFIGKNRDSYHVIEDNIRDIFRLGNRLVAVAGLAHLGSNYGMVYEVEFLNGKWHAENWRALPGAPYSVGRLKNSEIFVSTNGGGTVVLSENGQFRMIE